jgi:hypothetical protein
LFFKTINRNNQRKDMYKYWSFDRTVVYWQGTTMQFFSCRTVAIINGFFFSLSYDYLSEANYVNQRPHELARACVCVCRPPERGVSRDGAPGPTSQTRGKTRVYLEQGKQNKMCAFVNMWMTISCGYKILHTEVAPDFMEEPTNEFHRALDDV